MPVLLSCFVVPLCIFLWCLAYENLGEEQLLPKSCFHDFSSVGPSASILLVQWKAFGTFSSFPHHCCCCGGRGKACYVSMYLHFSVMGISQREMQWGIGMGMRTKQKSWEKNSSRQSLVLSKHHSLSKRLCCPGPCVLTLQHAPELSGTKGIQACQRTSTWGWPPVSLCCTCACTRCPQVPSELLQDLYIQGNCTEYSL